MKTIILKNLKIENFKGIKYLNIDFTDKNTVIAGPNASGKTTIFDAFNWLIFDKNSDYQTKFEIKPLDKDNKTIRVETKVTGTFEVDGKPFVLHKEYKEKWNKKHGETEETFTGNETIYEIDSIPVKKSDFKKAVIENFTEEELFKLLTNPLYFSNQLKWTEARQIILDIAGDVSVEDIITYDPTLGEIKKDLEEKGIDKFLSSQKATSKKLGKEKKDIPIKISELEASVIDVDINEINRKIKETETQVQEKEKEINGLKNNSEEINKANQKITELKALINDMKVKANESIVNENKKLNELRIKLMEEGSVNRIKMNEIGTQIKFLENNKENLLSETEQLRVEYGETAKAEFSPEVDEYCPLCKRKFDDEFLDGKREELLENFNKEKVEKLKKITERGNNNKKQIEEVDRQIEELKKQKQEVFVKNNKNYTESMEVEEKIKKLSKESNFTDEEKETMKKALDEIQELEDRIKELKEAEQTEEKKKLIEEKTLLNNEIRELTTQLGIEEANKNIRKRIEKLEQEEKTVSVNLAKIEKNIMLGEKYITTRVELLQDNINKHFKNVSFKLFEQQVNGGINETCEALIDGVPFNDTNTAAKINAGLDIINTIGEHYSLRIPIFIDNRESIIDLIDVDTQLINLKAEDIKNLTITGGNFNE